jgi:hypothetical protein
MSDPVEQLRSALIEFDANDGLVRYLWPVLDSARAVVIEHDLIQKGNDNER